MSRRKGELSPGGVDRGWPYQIAISESEMRKHPFDLWRATQVRLNACRRGHTVQHDNESWFVVCFATVPEAEAFKAQFGGVHFDPADRGKGSNWFQWRRPEKEPPLGGRRK